MQFKPKIAFGILMEAETETNPSMRPNTRPCVFPRWGSHSPNMGGLRWPSSYLAQLGNSWSGLKISQLKYLHYFWLIHKLKLFLKKFTFTNHKKKWDLEFWRNLAFCLIRFCLFQLDCLRNCADMVLRSCVWRNCLRNCGWRLSSGELCLAGVSAELCLATWL